MNKYGNRSIRQLLKSNWKHLFHCIMWNILATEHLCISF